MQRFYFLRGFWAQGYAACKNSGLGWGDCNEIYVDNHHFLDNMLLPHKSQSEGKRARSQSFIKISLCYFYTPNLVFTFPFSETRKVAGCWWVSTPPARLAQESWWSFTLPFSRELFERCYICGVISGGEPLSLTCEMFLLYSNSMKALFFWSSIRCNIRQDWEIIPVILRAVVWVNSAWNDPSFIVNLPCKGKLEWRTCFRIGNFWSQSPEML